MGNVEFIIIAVIFSVSAAAALYGSRSVRVFDRSGNSSRYLASRHLAGRGAEKSKSRSFRIR